VEYLRLEQDLKRHRAKEARGGPVGLGYRVPLIIASPWSRGGYVCSQVFDHTSVLRLLELVLTKRSGKEIREANISAWRRTVCGDLAATFRPFQSGDATVKFPARDAFLEQVNGAQFKRMPSGFRKVAGDDVMAWMPRQEPGVRASTALPYELAASGALSSDGKHFEIALEARNGMFGKAAAGAPFHVYTPGKFRNQPKLRTRAYAVAAGDRVTDSWEMAGFERGIYHLRVCGPNGFLREFAGDAGDPRVEIECEYVTGDVELRFANRGARALTIEVKDHGHKTGDHTMVVKPGGNQSLALSLGTSHRWYDFSVTINGAARFLRRFAGRVETGESGFSDPVMGGAVL
jgi:phospholipase C